MPISSEAIATHSLTFATDVKLDAVNGTATIAFDDSKNTYDDWGLIPSKKPVIVLPEYQESYTEIPGKNGDLDASDAVGLYYKSRRSEIEFYVREYPIVNGTRLTFEDLKRVIANYLHGKRKLVRLESDPAVAYSGRWYIDDMHTDDHYSMITLGYVIDSHGIWINATGHGSGQERRTL